MRPSTPRGFRDVLALEAAERDALVARVSGAMAAWGYEYVETPLVERVSTLEAVSGEPLGAGAFRLFDTGGELLALRPEMTVPVARLAACRLAGQEGPYRLRYVGRVVREADAMSGQPREFTQIGLELIGTNGAASDAEIIGAMTDALGEAGLSDFTVGVGTVAVLRTLIDAAGMEDAWGQSVLDAAHARNLVGIDRLSTREGVPAQVGSALRGVPRIRGGREAIDECRESAGAWAGDALDELEATWNLVEAMGQSDRVSIDFGIMRSFDYYTGVVLEAYGSGVGLPLGGGGRYDDVLATFDAPAPAAGFALRLERLHEALAAQDAQVPVRPLDAVLGGEEAAVFSCGAELRARGWRVTLLTDESPAKVDREASRRGAIAALVVADGRVMLVEGENLVPLADDAPPPSRSNLEGGGADARTP